MFHDTQNLLLMQFHFLDSFSLNCQDLKFCVFTPFSLIGKSISKMIREQALWIMIILYWPHPKVVSTQRSMLDHLSNPNSIKSKRFTATIAKDCSQIHLLISKMTLLAVHLSGQIFIWRIYLQFMEKKVCRQTKGFSRNSKNIGFNGKEIYVLQM